MLSIKACWVQFKSLFYVFSFCFTLFLMCLNDGKWSFIILPTSFIRKLEMDKREMTFSLASAQLNVLFFMNSTNIKIMTGHNQRNFLVVNENWDIELDHMHRQWLWSTDSYMGSLHQSPTLEAQGSKQDKRKTKRMIQDRWYKENSVLQMQQE